MLFFHGVLCGLEKAVLQSETQMNLEGTAQKDKYGVIPLI